MTLINQLEGAKYIETVAERGVVLAWHGGHGVHAYAENGQEIAFANAGDFANDEATLEEVKERMKDIKENPLEFQ